MPVDPWRDLRTARGREIKDEPYDPRNRPSGVGTAAQRPAATDVPKNSFFYATDTNVESFSNGTTWTNTGGSFTAGGNVVVSASNTDLAWDNGFAMWSLGSITTGGGSLRSLAVPTNGSGTRYTLRNTTSSDVTVKHFLAGGSGAKIYLTAQLDLVLGIGESVELYYDGAEWVELVVDAPGWHTYTPTWGNTGTANTLGDGVAQGRYIRIGKLVNASIYLGFGTTTVSGSGIWTFTFPVTPANVFPIISGNVDAVDAGVAHYIGVPMWNGTSTFLLGYASSAVGIIAYFTAGTTPFVFGNTDYVVCNFTYEAA